MTSQDGIMTSKEFFFAQAISQELVEARRPLRVLELGCGTAPYAPKILELFPDITYVGVEPFAPSFAAAQKRLTSVDRATVYHQLGYDEVAGLEPHSFDIVISLSVLEHVKQLGRFIALGAKYARPGALVVHRYDLGHALYSSSLKERFQVWLGGAMPGLLPEDKFVRHVPRHEVVQYFETHHGLAPHAYTYHQIPQCKALEKALRATNLPLESITNLYEWEFTHATTFAALPLPIREKLFPTVAVWGRQQ